MQKKNALFNLAKKISTQFELIPEVDAIALGGSSAGGITDDLSDIDLYVFSDEKVPLNSRKKIISQLGTKKENLELTFWDLGDQWIDKETGIEVDIIYWNKNWIEDQIKRILIQHQASLGYSTSFWHTLLNLNILFDREDWLANFQKQCKKPYPQELKKAIIEKNYPVLRDVIPSYYFQIQKAIKRNDIISINHRLAALLASYFDILFAINELPNPGEKKVLEIALLKCVKRPQNLKENIESLFNETHFGKEKLLKKLDILINELEKLLLKEKIL